MTSRKLWEKTEFARVARAFVEESLLSCLELQVCGTPPSRGVHGIALLTKLAGHRPSWKQWRLQINSTQRLSTFYSCLRLASFYASSTVCINLFRRLWSVKHQISKYSTAPHWILPNVPQRHLQSTSVDDAAFVRITHPASLQYSITNAVKCQSMLVTNEGCEGKVEIKGNNYRLTTIPFSTWQQKRSLSCSWIKRRFILRAANDYTISEASWETLSQSSFQTCWSYCLDLYDRLRSDCRYPATHHDA